MPNQIPPPALDYAPPARKHPLIEVALVFLKLGFTAFGGPAAHVALMEEEFVRRRKWLDRQHFLDMVSAVNFIPGPNSTEMAIHLGYLRAGFWGLVVAGVCFIVPAVLIILPLAWLYVTYGTTPNVGQALVGIKACMVAIVAISLWRFAVTGIKDRFTAGVAIVAAGAAWLLGWLRFPQAELIVLGAAALAGMIFYRRRLPDDAAKEAAPLPAAPPQPPGESRKTMLPPLLAGAGAIGATGFWAQIGVMSLFFLKVGATLFGSGYILASFLHLGLVEQYHWLSEQELLDAIAVGQVTPGPLLTAATFIGYVLGARNFAGGTAGGIVGAVAATIAIFLPAFVLIAMLGGILPKLRQSRLARGALDGMNAAVVALIAITAVWLGQAIVAPQMASVDWLAAALLAGSLVALSFKKVGATWVILAAGLIGAAARML